MFDAETLIALIREHGRYEPIHPVGEGGMGTVFKVRDPRMHKLRAMKVINPDHADHQQALLRFEQEARVTDTVGHPNIVRVYDMGELTEAGTKKRYPFIVIEWLDGGSLADHIEAYGAMPPRQAVEVAIGILQGLEAAHAHGIIHRDIKPDNVLFTSKGRMKIADFGIAQSKTAAHKTHTNMAMGTPGFMAPEQLTDAANVDLRADVFSVAVTLWNMLTGVRPPSKDYIWVYKFSTEPELMENIDPRLAAMLRKAGAMEREDRFETVSEFIGALQHSLDWFETITSGVPALGSVPGMQVEVTGMVSLEDVARAAGLDSSSDLPFDTPPPDQMVGGTEGYADNMPTLSTDPPDPADFEEGALPVVSTGMLRTPSSANVRVVTDPEAEVDVLGHTHMATASRVDVPAPVGTLMEASGQSVPTGMDFRPQRSRAVMFTTVALLAGGITAAILFFTTNLFSSSTATPGGDKITAAAPQPSVTARPIIKPREQELAEAKQPRRDPETQAEALVDGVAAAHAQTSVAEDIEGPPELKELGPVAAAVKVDKTEPKAKRNGKQRKSKRKSKRKKKPAAKVEVPKDARVRVSLKTPKGDPVKVWLIGSGGTHKLPAKVLPGTYKVKAKFKDRPAKVVISSYTVAPGSTPRLRCNSAFARCK